MKNLQDKVAVVTGAGTGLGKAVARLFAQQGAKVVLVGNIEEPLREATASITGTDHKPSCFVADLTNPDEVAAMTAFVLEQHGAIDVLVNNAGMSKEMPLLEMPMDIWNRIMTTNLTTAVMVTKAVLPAMVEQGGGNIVNVCSAAALRGLPGSSAYSASKAALLALSMSLGDEMRSQGVRVNAICPGPIDTELFQKSERREFILQAGGDLFEPETIANGILFLASDLSAGMSSQVLTMRGFNRW
ncbi:SDR family oxidoreductase [Oscillospiraceae bacterium MB08-C2-2]|nr:SDR family oxidoreductase [Oscillospiraceae bacterium MB08-C2-2]